MSILIIVLLTALVFIIIYQVGKANEHVSVLRGEEKLNYRTYNIIAWAMVLMFVAGMYGLYICNEHFKDKMLPDAASVTGVNYDQMFKVTLITTGIVFFATQALLFWFAFRYRSTEGKKSFYFAHSNKLELLWTTVPAIAMAILVAFGLKNWAAQTSDAPSDAAVVEIVGKQFNWIVRYPGADNEMGKRNYTLINEANNVLGLDWKDPHNMDDIISGTGELHVVVNKPVKLLINSRDVIHDVGLPHFRMKMDAVPGITTTIWFTPTITTDSMKAITKNPNFVYEISCDQMCGKGHYSMRGTVIVETAEQHKKWLESQKSYYVENHPEAAPAAAPAPKVDSSAKDKKVALK